jgi:head-tail adaptor
MAFYINPSELRTPIRIQKQAITGTGSFAVKSWVDLDNDADTDPPVYIKSKWVGLKGAEKLMSDASLVVGFSLATVRYRGDVNEQCRIVKDGVTYKIINIDDPTQRKQWLEITMVSAVMG